MSNLIESFHSQNLRILKYTGLQDLAPWQDMASELLSIMDASPKCQLLNRDVCILFEEDTFSVARAYTGSVSAISDNHQVVDLKACDVKSLPIDISELYNSEKLLSLKRDFAQKSGSESTWLRISPNEGKLEVRMENFLPFE